MQQAHTNSISSLYLLKAICAFGVVVLHAPIGVATEFLRDYFAMTVPVFFMITGYFLYTEDFSRFSARCMSTLKKVIPIIIICNLIYYPLAPISGNIRETYVLYFKWLAMGQTPAGGHLWYLTALVQGILSLCLFLKITKGRYVWVLIGFWGLNLALDSYRELIFGSPTSMMAANFIFKAIPCLATGYYVRQNEDMLIRLTRWSRLLIFSVVGIAFAYTLSSMESTSTIGAILLPLLVTLLIFSSFMTCIQNKSLGSNSPIFIYIGQKLSGNIYYWHGLFIFILSRFFTLPIYESLGAIIVFMLTLALAWGIVKIQDRMGWSILR